MNEYLIAYLSTLQGTEREYAKSIAGYTQADATTAWTIPTTRRHHILDTVMALMFSVTPAEEHKADLEDERFYDVRRASMRMALEQAGVQPEFIAHALSKIS